MMSTPFARAATCGFCPTPPKIVRVFRPIDSASGAIVLSTCTASSRVGTRTSPRGRRAAERLPASAETRGSANATVLPLPVRPRPSTSRPASESGRVALWIGNGASMPPEASDAMSAGATPRLANGAGARTGRASGEFGGARSGSRTGGRSHRGPDRREGWPRVLAHLAKGTPVRRQSRRPRQRRMPRTTCTVQPVHAQSTPVGDRANTIRHAAPHPRRACRHGAEETRSCAT